MILKRSFQFIFSALLIVMIITQLFSQKATNTIVICLLISSFWLLGSQVKLPEWFHSIKLKKIMIGSLLLINVALLLYFALSFQINDVSDPLNVQIKATELLNHNYNWHTSTYGNEEYFYVYPNVVFFTILLSKVMGLGLMIGLPIELTIRLFTFLLLAGVTLFSMLTVWTLTKKIQNLLWSALLLTIFPVMYLYPNMVTYTDTATMFLATLTIFFVSVALKTKKKIGLVVLFFCIAFFFSFLYAIKPNMIILLPASLAVLIMSFVLRMKNKKRLILITLAFVAGLAITTIDSNKVVKHYGFDSNLSKSTSLPVTHWINMGLNPAGANGIGSYDMNDDNNARQSKADEKPELINQSLKYRLKYLGISGLWKLSMDKAQMLLGTPLFGYGKYMSGFSKAPKFYLKHQALLNNFLSIIATTVLIWSSLGLLIKMWTIDFNTRKDYQESFIFFVGISSIGLALFHTIIWEVEPRYFLPLIYPLLLLNAVGERPLPLQGLLKEKSHRVAVIGLPLLTLILMLLTLQSSRTTPSIAFGNMQYPVRINFIKPVPLKKQITFTLPKAQAIDLLKVNIQPQKGLEVKLSDGTALIPINNQYVIEKHFDGSTDIKVTLINQTSSPLNIFLFERTNLFKPLFHGSSTEFGGSQYYLPYEMDIYDKRPFQSWNYVDGIPQ